MRKCVLPLLALAMVLCLPMTAHAIITVSFGNYIMAQGDQIVVPITISTDAAEEISAVDLYLQVEDGNTFTDGPYASLVDLLGSGQIFDVVSSSEAAYGDPWDTTSDQAGDGAGSTGLKPAFAVFANAPSGINADVPASGVLAYVTFDTNFAAIPGVYNVSFTMDDLGFTLMAKQTGTLENDVDYFLVDGQITVTPEPSSVLLGLFAAAGLAAVGVRRYRARRAA